MWTMGWVEILFQGNYELAIRFEVAPAVVKRGFPVQHRGGNSHSYKITEQYPEGGPA